MRHSRFTSVIGRRTLRYVLDFAHTQFIADLRGVLGFDSLTSFGAGCELDSSVCDIFVKRTRIVGGFQSGDNVSGWSLGLAVRF